MRRIIAFLSLVGGRSAKAGRPREVEISMPRGPRGERRPADVMGAAVVVVRLATGEIFETAIVNSGRTHSGVAGARARAKKLSLQERSRNAKKAVTARWG